MRPASGISPARGSATAGGSAPAVRTRPALLDPWSAALDVVLRGIRVGDLTVRTPDAGTRTFRGRGSGPSATVGIHDAMLMRRIAAGGSIAFAEGYMDGLWDTPDLDAVLDLAIANIRGRWFTRLPVAARPLQRLRHRLRDNDQEGSKRNIEYHYDLGNDFYALWLDETMTYSCACFDGTPREASLEQAQRHKWDRVLELIQPDRRDRILEIGCGWGGFAVHAAKAAGCTVTGITLSREQAAKAQSLVQEEGLEGRVDIRLEDYRSVPGTFTAIASIEMFEAVGERWWPLFFARMKQLLAPGRAAGLQVITIADDIFERYRRSPDFTQRYIFPGGMLPSVSRLARTAKEAGMVVGAPRFFGKDYSKTLSAWAERFESALPDVRALGFDERFVRMWRYYLSYCRAGFDIGNIDVMQVRLQA